MNDGPISSGTEYLTPSQAEEIEKKKKHRDFWLGFIGSIVLNLVIGGLIILAFALNGYFQNTTNPGNAPGILANLTFILPWVVNIAAIVLALVIRRPAIVLGILASYAVGFILSLCVMLIMMVVCFSQSGGF